MKLKRETHNANNTKLLETYSYYNRDKVLLQKLRQILEDEDVVFKPRDFKSIYSKVSNYDKNFGKELFKLIESFINLSKSRQLNNDSLISLFSSNSKLINEFLFEIEKYNTVLEQRNEIDFNDMINRAAYIVKMNKPDYKYQYIIIDEYQDISFARFNLIKEIRNQSGSISRF